MPHEDDLYRLFRGEHVWPRLELYGRRRKGKNQSNFLYKDTFSDDDWVKGPPFNPELGVQIHALQKGIFDAHIFIYISIFIYIKFTCVC